MNFKKRFAAIATTVACTFSAMSFSSASLSFVNATELSGRTAFQITREMNVGWNLGNTLDSTVNLSLIPDPTPEQSETAWGNPVTTKAMIDEVKKKGFNTIRIPTTWFQHVDSNFTIDADWLARVKEIVDYCYDNDMYVILNVHHEAWINRSDFDEAYDEMSGKLTKLWKQIAEYFGDYDQHLIFEGMNEPRAADTPREWWNPTDESKDIINMLNADFVKTVRNVNSKYNSSRLLMIPAYCASSDPSVYGSLNVPDDDHIAVSVHAYKPFGFTMDKEASHDSFTSAMESELDGVLASVRTKFISNNIPVVIGEMSASNYHNTAAREKWAEAYASLAKKYGLPIVLWDNNVDVNPTDPGEAHGYFNRAQLSWYSESSSVADVLINTYNSDNIKFGEEGIAPVYTHADINSGKVLGSGTYNLDTSVKDGNTTPFFDFNWSMIEGKEIAVEYSGEVPKAAMMDDAWDNWTDPDAYETNNGIAYYSADDLKSKWSAATTPSHLGFAIYTGNSTITKIAIIDAPTKKDASAIEIPPVIENPTEPTEPTEPVTTEPVTTEPVTQPTTEETTAATTVSEVVTTSVTEVTDPTEPTTTPVLPTEPTTIEIGTPSLIGDVDLNGLVSISDITRLAKFISSSTIYPLTNSTAAANADINRDKSIDQIDNSILIEYMLNKITSL